MPEFGTTYLFNDANLKAYYKLEDVNDNKGSSNLTNAGTTTFVAGKYNNAANFAAASSQFLWKSGSDALTLGTFTTARSYSLWFNLSSNPADGGAYEILANVFDKDAANVYDEIWYTNTAGVFDLLYTASNNIGATTGGDRVGNLADSNWHHAVLTYTGGATGTQIAYFDGVKFATTNQTFGSALSIANPGFKFGTLQNTDRFLSGKVDDAAIFNRVLTAAEVQQIYQTGSLTLMGVG